MTRPALKTALLTALAYAVLGVLAVQQAAIPGLAVAVFPAAGLALGAALVWGVPAIVGVALGAAVAGLSVAATDGTLTPAEVAIAATLSLGATAQAAIGRALVRRFVAQPLLLDELPDLLRYFVFGGAIACLASASISIAFRLASGTLPAAMGWGAWSTWWLGDVLGVLLFSPIVLALFGRPRSLWAPRRTVLVAPLLLTTLLLSAAIAWAAHTDMQRLRAAFERDAWSLADALDAQLRRPMDVLQAMHGLFDSQQQVEPAEMARATAPWLHDQPFIAAIGYSQRVDPAAVPAFEARARAEGPDPGYRVFERDDGSGLPPSPLGVVAIRLIEPLASNREALGVDAMSVRAARTAIQRAAATGETVATSAFRLTQARGSESGIVLYRALYEDKNGAPQTDEARRGAFVGVVFVALRLDALVQQLSKRLPAHLAWCLVDLDPGAEQQRLAGPAGCEARRPGTLHYARAHAIGPHALQWRIDAEPWQMPDFSGHGTTLFAGTGLVAAALLSALLLLVSGRQRRIEQAVAERTADLRSTGRALQDSQARLRSILQHLPIGVLHADTGGRIDEANPALLGMLGLDRLPQPAPTLSDCAHADDRAELARLLQTLGEGGPPVARMELRLVGSDGAAQTVSAVRTVRLALSTLQDGDGSARRLVGVVEDIGEHLRLQASESARLAAEAASQAKSEFVGRMSHELRTPLNAMLGFAQLLARDGSAPLASHQRRWVDQVQDAGWHLLNMINDTLDLSRIESGALRLDPVALDTRALLDATLSMVAGAAERQHVQLQPPRIAAATPAVWGDETRVKQVLTNLLSNAVKYNVEGGRVEVEVGPDAGSRVRFRIRDTGIGLSAEQIGRLFQPFDRLGRERSGIEGTGIGLVISRLLAQAMGGTLQAHSTPGEGSVFELCLPGAPAGSAPAPATSTVDSSAGYRRRRVHYVEDNETNVLLMQGMLAQRPQIALSVSTMGLDALAAVRVERPDLLLLDMHLPDIDGLDLLIHLKADDATTGIPVVVLSADATSERVRRALQAGAEAYLSKPLDVAVLLQHVDAILAQADTTWSEHSHI